ncbi:MAG: phenylacetate--CoA ligase family protein [Planctomycetes bacterium]|nr:phenylacetate--CoA ligase family protein [Planctomycetota bacterium]
MVESIGFRIYKRLPVFCQNVVFSLKGLQNHHERYNRYFHNYLSWLRESEWWSGEEIYKYQNEKLRHIVAYAYENIPFYKRWFDEHGIRPNQIKTQEDLNKLPILTKQTVRDNQDELISHQYKKRQLLRRLTSGTTGTALTIYAIREATAFQWAIWWRHRARFGFNIGDSHLSFGARIAVPVTQKRPPFWRQNLMARQTYISTYHMTHKNLPVIVDWINKHDFDFYAGYPSAIYVLANFLSENNMHLLHRPKCIICGSEALLPTFERCIREVLGVPVTEQYGMAEFAGNMAKCECGKFHLDFECCCVEAIPMSSASDGYAKLIFTGWGNPAMPFIRYDVGDYAVQSKQVCRCGRESICFDSVDGRIEDYIRTPDGRMAIGMNQVFEYAPGAKEIQIYQGRLEEIEVRVVPGRNYTMQDEQALLLELRQRVGNEINIKFVLVDHIPRTSSGKFRAVVSGLTGQSEGEEELKERIER